MTSYKYATIVSNAAKCKTNVEKHYKLGVTSKWSYYFAKSILYPGDDIKKIQFKTASKPTGTAISRQIPKNDYRDIAKRLIKYVETNKKLPNYITYKNYKIRTRLYTYLLAKIVVYQYDHKLQPNYVNVNYKVFYKPTETGNTVYDYFVKVFGKVGSIDEALGKIAGRGYGYYYDDVYSNKESINRMKNRQGVNCTDSCQVFYNIATALIKQGKYRKVECLHVKCQGGDGHVRLRITLNDGTKIYRDPAAVLDNGNVASNWCLNGTLLSINPQWFMNNLNR